MNAIKSIILIFVLTILPLFAFAQFRGNVTKRQSEQIGKRTYITSTGDTTLVVNPLSQGLNNEYTRFLYTDPELSDPELDSIFSDPTSSYSSLEAAALDMNRLLRDIETGQKESKGNNDALAWRIANFNRQVRKKEMEAKEIAEELVKKDRSVEELAALYVMFGDRPTYYINGVEVPYTVINQLYPNEIIKTDRRTSDTASGNPNGEVWHSVTEKALSRIKLPMAVGYQRPDEITVYNVGGAPMTKDLSTYMKEVQRVEREKAKADLKALPVVRREIGADGKQIDITVSAPVESKESINQSQQLQENTSGTRVISRTVNSQGGEAAPANQTETGRRSAPVVRRYTNEPTTNSAPVQNTIPVRENSDNKNVPQQEVKEKEDDKPAPKKSVRAIKERQRSQYQDDIEDDLE
ncbi:MAG: hypothetical protein LBV43_09885 [Prevotella sp.]|jgi:hypothetical protein|nr:hypothetical protein [Prevotella sp.]